jgi:alpha-amylase/alpha-mannosidase (GH57 family)
MPTSRIPLVLHAHFYQPPRDNPWTEAVEREASAAPFHDWNARIDHECYSANAHARVFGTGDRVSDIINNYAHLNFNIGPTLFAWLEQHAPKTCRAITLADRLSAQRNNGHGGAIAQAWSHAILPLCNERDRNTQIRWGIADFRRRFQRAPEAMWLPETGCDLPTAAALVAHGMRYVILSPHQAERARHIGGDWADVSDGSIDPRVAYRLQVPGGGSIVCFFYDGAAAHAVSFEGVLDTSRGFAERLRAAASPHAGSQQLVHLATDGETYGHHRRYADRSLAYFIWKEANEHGLELTNYAAWLDQNGPRHEVELKRGPMGEGTAWSCAHGLGRWTRDCGCNAGRGHGWSQAWRGPLRAAFDQLRDHAADVLQSLGGDLLHDVWQARDEYIEVVMEPTREQRDAYLRKHARTQLSAHARVRLLKLLEAHRMTQLMYASCGWFFDDISGLETQQVMKYAARATQLLDDITGHRFMPRLIDLLAEARGNISSEGSGADVMRRRVLRCEVGAHVRIAERASRQLFSEVPLQETDPAFSTETLDHAMFERGSYRLVLGRARVTRTRTEQTEEVTYAAATLNDRDMHCGIKATVGREVYAALLEDANSSFQQPTPTELIRLVDRHLGPMYYSVRDLSERARSEFIDQEMRVLLGRLGATYGFLYDEHRKTIEALEIAGVEVPNELKLIAQYTLARRLDSAVLDAHDGTDPDMVRTATSIARDARELGVKLEVPRTVARFAALLLDAANALGERRDARSARDLLELLELTRSLGLEVPVDAVQEVIFPIEREGGLSHLAQSTREALAATLAIIPSEPAVQVLGS